MALRTSAPWHQESFERFLHQRLPELLAARLPLSGYCAESTGTHTCRVVVTIGSKRGEVKVEYQDVPQPDNQGVFEVEEKRRVVVPTASCDDLDVAEIRCVGEQLYDFIEKGQGEAPRDLRWDPGLVRAWLPLDERVRQFLQASPTCGKLEEQNWLATCAHLRRLLVLKREKWIAPGQFARTCPFETPEGPNLGRVLHVAVGAEIRDGRLVVVDETAEAALGVTASMVPFLEHNDANRQLMGVNMMRQWFVPPEPEPAYVQTGNEPGVPGFWCGRNLLTAFVSWGADTFDDGIVISESAAMRLDFPYKVEVGDKLSNRHGSKGTVTRILPDEEMPHLADGTPVELVFSFMGCHTRLNFGQYREAVMSRIARVNGEPAIVPPFHAPSEEEIRRELVEAGLPESGTEVLTLGRRGKKLLRPSTVGWLYWGRLEHLSRKKVKVSATAPSMRSGTLEYFALRDVGAFENLAEQFNTRAAGQEDAKTLAGRLQNGPVKQSGPPTPKFARLVRRLNAAGIQANLEDNKLTFRFAPPTGAALELAYPVRHPWLGSQELTEIGGSDQWPGYQSVVEANTRVRHIIESGAPEGLKRSAFEHLERSARAFLEALLAPEEEPVLPGGQTVFSGKAVLSCGPELSIDQVDIYEEIAWVLFAPLVTRELGSRHEVQQRTPRAAQALDKIMARSWVLINRAPTLSPMSIIAFHPVRCPDPVIRLHPLACRPMNADFDGDQAAVFLPVTEAAQREAGELLSIVGHLRRDPGLLKQLLPPSEALWGLAVLSLSPEGQKEVSALAGVEVALLDGFLTMGALEGAMRRVLARDGAEKTLEVLERLTRRGFEVAKESGASMNPFIGQSLEPPAEPDGLKPDGWWAYVEEVTERIASRTDFADDDIGPQLLAVKTGARGSLGHLAALLGAGRPVTGVDGTSVIIRHGFNRGYTSRELFAWVPVAREGLGQTLSYCKRQADAVRQAGLPKSFNVLARAMRAKRPGVVFALAAATGEVDPLADLDSRLFVGLPVART